MKSSTSLNASSQKKNNAQISAVSILDVPVHTVTIERALEQVELYMSDSRLHQIATVNPEFIMKAQEDESFQKVLQSSDLCLPDGIGLLLASRWLRQPLPERVAGSDFVYKLAALSAEKGWRLFLLGAEEGIAREAASVLKEKFQGLAIAGTYSGSPDVSENEAIVHQINASQADILYVAFGAPRQDKWIDRNRESLETVRVAMGVGGSLDFITGQTVRAPLWIQRLGLEWLHRLIQEPWRWRRMMALPRFAAKVAFYRKQP
jgi:N-acetylglucosaminyldiphosphoundecaprenol N-acetyl-beta-D-mannosaminyltransferase